MSAAVIIAKKLKYSIWIGGDLNARTFDKREVTIGRGLENDLILGADQKVSRVHLKLFIQDNRLFAKNVSQKNFILVDGQKVDEAEISETAQILIGDTVLKIEIEKNSQQIKTQNLLQANHVVQPQHLSIVPPGSSESQKISNPPSFGGAAISSNAAHGGAPPNQYGNGHMGSTPQNFPANQSNSNRMFLYIGVIFVIGLIVFNQNNSEKKRAAKGLRTQADVIKSIEESQAVVKKIDDEQKAKGTDTAQYREAQQYFLKGFRDYRQGQYARAMEAFRAALAAYPQHQMAAQYKQNAERKFYELVDFQLSLGLKYKSKQNYRLCTNSFAQVMTMIKDPSREKYKEAKQNYDECQAHLEKAQ